MWPRAEAAWQAASVWPLNCLIFLLRLPLSRPTTNILNGNSMLNAGLPQAFNNLSRSEAKHNSPTYDCVGARSPQAADSTLGAGATESAVQEDFQNKGPVGPC